jgi:crotonobetainyl-CoA:carnitine CoA-transferase CaiB-like acyl-CoA transferase
MGAMIAHYYRQAGGKGQHVDTSIQQSVLISALTVPQSYDLQGYIWPRRGAFIPRSGKKMRHLWPCKDGYIAWRLFGGGLGVKTRALVDWMDSEGMAGDLTGVDWPQMDIISVSPEQYHAWQDTFAAFFKTHTKAEICREALARGIVLFPASTPQDLLADTQLEARHFWKEVDYPGLGTITYPGTLYQSTEIDWELSRAPSIGEHNREVLHEEMGLSEEKINTLQQNGII